MSGRSGVDSVSRLGGFVSRDGIANLRFIPRLVSPVGGRFGTGVAYVGSTAFWDATRRLTTGPGAVDTYVISAVWTLCHCNVRKIK